MIYDIIFYVAFALICGFIVFLFGIMAVGSFYEIRAEIAEAKARKAQAQPPSEQTPCR
jgi:hypothetical protein